MVETVCYRVTADEKLWMAMAVLSYTYFPKKGHLKQKTFCGMTIINIMH